MKPANLQALRTGVATISQIPLDEGFTPETSELATLIYKLNVYIDKLAKPAPKVEAKK